MSGCSESMSVLFHPDNNALCYIVKLEVFKIFKILFDTKFMD